MATFGKTTDGGSTTASGVTRAATSVASPATSGTVVEGRARAWLSGAGTKPTKFVIYADNSGTPGALLAESDILDVTNTAEAELVWSFSGANQIAVVASTNYWIGVFYSGSGGVSFKLSRGTTAAAQTQSAASGSTWPTAPDPFTAPGAAGTVSGPIDAYVVYNDAPTYTAPGTVFDLSAFKLTLPFDGPDGGSTADEVDQADLPTYADQYFNLDGSNQMVMTAPVQGDTTGGSGGVRCELREMDPGDVESDWSIQTAGRRLTVSGYFDPTNITDRKEMIVGQIHATGGTPPIYLAIEHHVASPRLRLYKDGPGVTNLATALTTATLVSYEILALDGRLKVRGVAGTATDLLAVPYAVDYAYSDFAEYTGCYFKVGAYNKSEVANGGTGEAISKIVYLNIEQAVLGTTPLSVDPGRGFFGFFAA